MTQIQGWHRTDNKRRNETIWKHDTGVKIVLTQVGREMHCLMLFDRHGVEDEDCRTYDGNRERLERVSTKWQKSYNDFLNSTR